MVKIKFLSFTDASLVYIILLFAQAIAIVDLPDSNGENAVAKLKKEFDTDNITFLAGNVANAKELTGIL